MDCQHAFIIMNKIIDGETTRRMHPEFMAHLDNCPGCRRDFQRMTAVVHVLKEAPQLEVPSFFAQSVMSHIRIPLHRRVANWIQEKAVASLYRPVLAFSSITMVILIWISYISLYTTVKPYFNPDKLKSAIANAELWRDFTYAIKNISFIALDIVTTIMGSIKYLKVYFDFSATLVPLLSYLIPIAIVGLLTWMLVVNYYISHFQSRRWHYAYAKPKF